MITTVICTAIIVLVSLFLTNQIVNKMEELFAKAQAALASIDASTNRIANDLTELKEKVIGGGLPAELEAQIVAGLEAAANKLQSVGVFEEEKEEEVPTI
jgi:hypothetical protein